MMVESQFQLPAGETILVILTKDETYWNPLMSSEKKLEDRAWELGGQWAGASVSRPEVTPWEESVTLSSLLLGVIELPTGPIS